MKIQRTLAFTKRALMQFRHDRRTLAFVLVMPLLMMLVFGYAFGGDPTGLDIAIVNLDTGVTTPIGTNISFAESIIDNLDDETYVLHYYDNREGAKADLQEAELWAVFYFPADFSTNLFASFAMNGTETSTIEVDIDDSNPNLAASIMQGLQEALMETQEDITTELGLPEDTPPISIQTTNEYGDTQDIEFIDYFAPGIVSYSIMMVTVMISIILFVGERREGTLQRLLVSPASETEIVVGYALAFGVIGLIQSVVILSAAILIFDVNIAGSIFLALFVVILLAIGHQGLGILLSSAANNELQAIQFIPLIVFPSVLLAGLFWPVESIPSFLQPLAYFIPLKYGIDAERSIMLRGWGIAEVWPEITILILFAILTLTASILLLKRRK
ncbi:MAG: ABC transporter permease [Thermoplasmata archaeon]|nr:ABC transporter permease [Thermoplasmata archaeon]